MDTLLYASIVLAAVALLALVAVVFSLVGAIGSMADRMFAERAAPASVDALSRLRHKRATSPAPPESATPDEPVKPMFSEEYAKDFDQRV